MDRKVSVLVAEDDENLGRTLLEELTAQQYDVFLVSNGQLAIEKLIDKRFDVIILDLKMPIVSGYAILKYVKATMPATKVIVLTAYTNINNIEECKKLGADDVLTKPYEPESLFEAIKLQTVK